jgi:hypothetical protein
LIIKPMNCKVCDKQLTKKQKSTCSWGCRSIYVGSFNKNKPSPFKGKTRWTDEQKKKIGDGQRGVPKSDEFREKCRQRMKGIAFNKGRKLTEEQRINRLEITPRKENHWNWKGGERTMVIRRREKNGFSKELFEALLKEQGGLCAICNCSLETGLTSKAACADHCHVTKQPRGILCKKCNLLLGHAKDDTEILAKAIEYLNMWKRTA